MKIFIERENKRSEIKVDKISVKALLDKLKIKESEVIVIRNGEILTNDDMLYDADEISLISVISGG